MVTCLSFTPVSPAPEPGPRLLSMMQKVSGTPDQVRGDGGKAVRKKSSTLASPCLTTLE